MQTELKMIRRHNGNDYKFYVHKPDYEGEKGVLGIVIEPYVTVETPENCFGYTDTVFYAIDGFTRKPYVYTAHRYLQPWILAKLKRQMEMLMKQEGII